MTVGSLLRLVLTSLTLLGTPATAFAELKVSSSEPDLRLLWYDPEKLLPHGFAAVASNFERLFREVGVTITLEQATGIEHGDERQAVRVIAVSRTPSSWELGPDVLAVAPDPSVHQRSVYVILPRVRRELRHTETSAANIDLLRHRTEMSRALSRLIAHELVHAVAPAHPHAASGLMRDRQPRSFLLKQKMRMDPKCVGAFKAGLADKASLRWGAP